MKNKIPLLVSILFFSMALINAQVLEFQSLSNMNYDRFGLASATDGKYIYAINGGTGVSPWQLGTIEKFDLATNTWNIVLKDIMPRRFCNAEYIQTKNVIYIFNGDQIRNKRFIYYPRNVEILDLATGQVSLGTENPYPVSNGGSAVWENKIYFFGGENSNGYSERLYVYDPLNLEWTRLPDMFEAKHTNGKIIDGILYTFGGYKARRSLTEIDAYDIEKATWTHLGNLPFKLSSFSAVVQDKLIWIIGSFDDADLLACFDTQTGKVTRFDSNFEGRTNSASQIVNNKLYVFGGNKNVTAFSATVKTEFADVSKASK
jgi:hypothetical protein